MGQKMEAAVVGNHFTQITNVTRRHKNTPESKANVVVTLRPENSELYSICKAVRGKRNISDVSIIFRSLFRLETRIVFETHSTFSC